MTADVADLPGVRVVVFEIWDRRDTKDEDDWHVRTTTRGLGFTHL